MSLVALDGRDESDLLSLAAGLARNLDTSLGSAILESAREREIAIPNVDQFHETARAGVVASVAGHKVVLGNSALFAALGLSTDALGDWPDRLRQQGQSLLFVAVDGRTAGFFGVKEDEMRNSPLTEDHFPTATAGLPQAHSPEVLELTDGNQFDLRIAPVTKRLGDALVRMLA